MCSPASFWLLHEFWGSWQSKPLHGDGITVGFAQRASFAQCTSRLGTAALSAHPSQFFLRKMEQAGALCGVEHLCSETMKKLECIFLVKSTARTSKQQPQIQPFEDGEASTASGYQSHKLFITKKRNPSYDSLSLPVQTPLKNSLLGVILEWDDLEIRITSSYNSLKPYLHPGQFFILLNIVLGNSWAKDYCASKMMYAWG